MVPASGNTALVILSDRMSFKYDLDCHIRVSIAMNGARARLPNNRVEQPARQAANLRTQI